VPTIYLNGIPIPGGLSVPEANHSFFRSVIYLIPNMLFQRRAAIGIFIIFVAVLFAISLFKQHVRNEYLMMLMIYAGICVVNEQLFHKGYPVIRAMLPVYPLFVLAVAKAVDGLGTSKWLGLATAACVAILCVQFAAQASLSGTRAWKSHYLARADILRYVATHTLDSESEEDFEKFIAGYANLPSMGAYRYRVSPITFFYFQKMKYMLDSNSVDGQ